MRTDVKFGLGAIAALAGLAGAMLWSRADAQAERFVPRSAAEAQASYAPIVREAAPAVVNVYARRRVADRPAMFEDPFFEQFFGELGMPRERIQQSLGSGVIVRADGVIVTNNHVVAGAQELRIVLNDRREFDAELILADPRTDLAVLRIEAGGERLPFLAFADSGGLEIGDLVLAIGNPFGVGQTVTQGIVSAKGRSEVTLSDFSFFIQTDAAINPGNSGGALVDMRGALAGVNTAIFSRSGGSNGIGFAIPAELVARVVDQALTEGKIIRPWIGARLQTVTRDIAGSLNLDRPQGVLVADVVEDGPAEKAGLKAGDVIRKVDGVEVNDDTGVRFRVATVKLGERASLDVVRDGRPITVMLRAEAPPETPARDERRLDGQHPLAGATVVNLSPGFNDEVGLDLFQRGVAIWRIERGSAAEYYGFQPGDVLIAVNGEAAQDTRGLARIAADFDGARTWRVDMERAGQRVARTVRW